MNRRRELRSGPGPGRYLMRHVDGPLRGKRIVVVGCGPIGIYSALDLAAQGASVIMMAAHPLGAGVAFMNAAGLLEPFASKDPAGAALFLYGHRFAQWAQPDPDWGLRHRSVLLMSDYPAKLEEPWITALESARPAREHELPPEGPAFGVWFDTFVLQPDYAIVAIRRELKSLGVRVDPTTYEFRTCREAVEHAKKVRADAVVLAAGIGLADFDDLWDIDDLGEWMGLTAGMGATKRIDRTLISLDYVLMDIDSVGYLIPQIDWVIAGGTNHPYEVYEPLASASKPTREMISEVEEKIERLWPGSASLPGKWLLGARPMRETLLRHHVGARYFGLPVVLAGGAGGSGWTYCAGIGAGVSGVLIDILSSGERLPLFGEIPLEIESRQAVSKRPPRDPPAGEQDPGT